MIALTIIIVLLILLLAMPVGADVSFISGALTVKIKAGPAKVKVLPAKPKSKKADEKPPKPPKAKKPKKPKEENGKQKQKITREDIFGIARLGLKALSRLRKSLSIDVFMLHLTAGAPDPYDAVMQYGYVNAGLCTLQPLMHRALKIHREDIRTGVDLEAGKTSVDLRVAATYRIWQILYIALCAGFGFLVVDAQAQEKSKA